VAVMRALNICSPRNRLRCLGSLYEASQCSRVAPRFFISLARLTVMVLKLVELFVNALKIPIGWNETSAADFIPKRRIHFGREISNQSPVSLELCFSSQLFHQMPLRVKFDKCHRERLGAQPSVEDAMRPFKGRIASTIIVDTPPRCVKNAGNWLP